ncbi:MAG: RAMP superfamily CRISPR-associated protein [Hydrogenothermaceae bacterium]|nr:RAMP superfamily CRISPR-associated protein [Hydrogenothermaceae bacterium]
MAKYDFFAEKIVNTEDEKLPFDHYSFLNLKFSNLNKKDNILNKFKGSNYKLYRSFFDKDFLAVCKISGIYQNLNELQNHINKLPKYSFAIWFEFNLEAPYFSKDDDEFYIIQNPVLKEKNFKVPMIRGSGWKGALAHSFRELFEEGNNKEKIESFLRIFGAGSESIKAIESYILKNSGNLEKAKEQLLSFMLFELGLKVTKEKINEIKSINNINKFIDTIKELLSKKLETQSDLPTEFKTHKGRAIFYPTYFNRLSLEVINPHDRRKRAGTKPIHYEVVPKETKGIFQMIYIPFDGILKNDEILKQEINEDLNNLCTALENLANNGIGAKTKLGWGRFEIENKKVCINQSLEIPKGWQKCQD